MSADAYREKRNAKARERYRYNVGGYQDKKRSYYLKNAEKICQLRRERYARDKAEKGNSDVLQQT